MAASPQSTGGPAAGDDGRAGAAALERREIARLSIDTIRALSMDGVQKANAGHPGTAMALAPLGYTLFQRFLRVNPGDTGTRNRLRSRRGTIRRAES